MSLTLDKSKGYFVEMKISNLFYIADVNVYRCSNLIKSYYHLRTNWYLVTNLKQNSFEVK